MPTPNVTRTSTFELLEDGSVVRNMKNGTQVPMAQYDQESGHLEFKNDETAERFRSQIIRAIQDDEDGQNLSGLEVKSMGIAGRERDEIKKNEPRRPRSTRLLGDKTPELVEWYFKWRPQEAYVRYGVRLDKRGEPVRADCLRRAEAFVDQRDRTDKQIKARAQTDGPNSETSGAVIREITMEEHPNVIIATRATHMTFLPSEMADAERGEELQDDLDNPHQREGGAE